MGRVPPLLAVSIAFAACGGRTGIQDYGAPDASAGGAPFPGSGGAASAGSGAATNASGGAVVESPCGLRDIGSTLGIPVAEGILAGSSTFASNCGGIGPEAWLHWSAPADGKWAFDTKGSAANVILTALEPAGCSSSKLLSCDASDAAVVLDLKSGEEVIFVVDTNADATGYVLNISGPIGVPVSTCASIDLSTRTGSPIRVGRFRDEIQYPTTLSCAPGPPQPTVVTRWSAPSRGSFSFDARGSNFDAALEVRSDCATGSLGCSASGESRQVEVFLEKGQTVDVFVGASSGILPATASYALDITERR